jgi:hypothetical protein
MLTVKAENLTLDGAAIKANSTGNVAASELRLVFTDRLSLNGSSITTSANAGNGGAISIAGGQLVDLEHSQITTSVLGLSGNGGDIKLSADALAMNTGFIQANTAARSAAGGNVDIDIKTLVTSGNLLFIGGLAPYAFAPGVFGFNVVQAAAPTGISGSIQVAAPVLDVSGSLTALGARLIDAGGLGRNPCQTAGGSSLALAGRGGFPPSSQELLGPEPQSPTTGLGARLNSPDQVVSPTRRSPPPRTNNCNSDLGAVFTEPEV